MTIDLQDLVQKALAATQGNWLQSVSFSERNVGIRGVGVIAECKSSNDAAHIAANSPDVTRALVRRIRKLESALYTALYLAGESGESLESKGHSMAPHHELQMKRLRVILREGLVDL